MDPETAALFRAAAKMCEPGLIDGADLQVVYDTFVKALVGPGLPNHMRQLCRWALVRIGAYELAERLGGFEDFASWTVGAETPLFLQQLPRVRSAADRMTLLDQHRAWGAGLESRADRSTLAPPSARRGGRIRIGFISGGFDQIVGRFCLPLFEHQDPRFEMFAYAFGGNEAYARTRQIMAMAQFRRLEGSATDRARIVAADDLDLLIELDGLAGPHALDVMAHRPARRQASWIGYPHSTGAPGIDYLIMDPYLRGGPLLEQPLVLPKTWICLPTTSFREDQVIAAGAPEARRGHLTFGTLNNPYKFTLESIQTWARIVAACPGAKFLFARPEAGAPTFQKGMIRRFGAEGVSEDRLLFDASKGRHMALYNDIDISLDPFPLTGGTTTAEALWMGVPVISLTGETMFERMSYSLLVNAGLPELAVETVDDYKATAIALAKAPARRADIRAGLRAWLKASPLGRPELFARDFFDTMANAIAEDGRGR